jgi:hypothetical protein
VRESVSGPKLPRQLPAFVSAIGGLAAAPASDLANSEPSTHGPLGDIAKTLRDVRCLAKADHQGGLRRRIQIDPRIALTVSLALN